MQNKIAEEQQSIYYSLEDEPSVDPDTSGPNYSQASFDEKELPELNRKNNNRFFRHPFVLMLMTLLNPVEGWKDIRRLHITAGDVQRKCFYPLLLLLAIANSATLFYFPQASVGRIIADAFVAFMAYFIGFFCIIIIIRFLVPRKCIPNIDNDFTKIFVLVNLSSLCLFFIFIELFPMFWAILIFLPLWTIYSVCKGVRFFRFPQDKRLYCTSLFCISIVGMPPLIEFCLNEIIF